MKRRTFPSNPDAAIPASPAESELDLGALGRAIWRRKFTILFVTLLAAVGAFLAVNVITPRYKSEARVIIENRETPYNQAQGERNAERDRTLLDAEAVQSQVQLALSRDLARNVISSMKFSDRPEFNPSAGGSIVSGLLALVGLSRDPSRMSTDERILERYYERLSVYQVEKSRVIAIEFQSEDAEFAARVANAIAEGYIKLQQQAKQDTIKQAGQWLAGEIERLRSRVAESESKVEEFRSKSNLYVGPNNNPLSAQQLGDLNSQLATARTRKSDAETKSRLIRDILKSGKPVETSEVLNSELIRRLNEQRVTLRAQLAEQSSTLLELHPRIKELKAQIGDLEVQTRIEADKIARSFENDARLASAQADSILAALDMQKKQSTALGGQDVQLRSLERDAKSQRDLLESYLARYRDTLARETPDAVQADARIISRALANSTAHFPKKLPIILIATIGAFLAMVSFIAAGQLLSGGVYRAAAPSIVPAEEVLEEAEVEAPVRAARPAVQSAAQIHGVADLSGQVRLMGRGIVLITRSAQEPSSELALQLARDLAAGGGRTVFADFDPETNVADRTLSPGLPGVSDLVSGSVSFADAIQRDAQSRAHILGAGRVGAGTAELLAAPRLATILGALAQTYDHVVVALPDLTRYSHASRLARFARGTVLVTGDRQAGGVLADQLAGLGFRNVVVVEAAREPRAAPNVAA